MVVKGKIMTSFRNTIDLLKVYKEQANNRVISLDEILVFMEVWENYQQGDDYLCQADLAKKVGVEKSCVNRHLHSIGDVTRSERKKPLHAIKIWMDPKDMRRRCVTITAKGTKLAQNMLSNITVT